MPARGPRIRVTVRLPYDEFHEAALRARARGWSMSDYVGYCVAREMGSKRVRTNGKYSPSPAATALMREWPEAIDEGELIGEMDE